MSSEPQNGSRLRLSLIEFLKAQRWFAGKARGDFTLEVADSCTLSLSDGSYEILVLNVQYAPNSSEMYLLPVKVDSGDDRYRIREGLDSPELRSLMLAQLADQGELSTRRGRLLFRKHGDFGVDKATDSVKISGEQSNTSLIYDRSLVFKLYRRLSPFPSVEQEILEALSKGRRSQTAPALLGTVSYELEDRLGGAGAYSAGLFTEYIPNRGDCWEYFVSELTSLGSLLSGNDCKETNVPPGLSLDVSKLGEFTAQLHTELGGLDGADELKAEPIYSADVQKWNTQLFELASETVNLAASAGLHGDQMKVLEDSVQLVRSGVALSWLDTLVSEKVFKIRVHGDYHLGQVFKVPGGFVAFDFEGEPARSREYRRAKYCSLKDVAGMFRSIRYAASYCSRALPSLEEQYSRVADALGETYLSKYWESAASSRVKLVPSDYGSYAEALRFYVLEKTLYEVGYELNNRPDWISIPLNELSRLLAIAK
ncbi:MAG: hypothetical protein QW767_01500 [Thermoprotei archaeon]